jgi:predicted metal-dependent hydrolase
MFNRAVQFQFSSEDSVLIGGQSVPVQFVTNPKARRYILRLRANGHARVTVPRRGSMKAAREFLERNTHWLTQQLQRLAARPTVDRRWLVGTEILFRGELVKLLAGSSPQSVALVDQVIPTHGHDDVRDSVEQRLRALATVELPPRVFELAQQHGLTVKRVTVRNQKSRWGSCSRRGTVSLNWRLIQMPPFVSDYIVLHELMHLRQMNHSQKFWLEVASVCPRFREAERWLKQHATLLRK